MRRALTALALCSVAVAMAAAAAAQETAPPPSGEQPRPPQEIGLVEKSGTRLAQLDVTVLGPAEVVRALQAGDFKIKINLQKLTEFTLDRFCPAATEQGSPGPDAVDPPPRPRASYLFYFDQTQLTLGGRQRALDLARDLIPRLLVDEARAMIVSNAARLEVIEPLTADPDALIEALRRLENDREQWGVWAEQERLRVEEVMRQLNQDQDVQQAISLARLYQKEERWRTEQALRRLEMSLGPLVELESPKAMIYFADTLRSNPGDHYLSFFGQAMQHSEPALAVISSDSLTSRLPFDRVVNEAAAQGIRVYTVEAQGMQSGIDASELNPRAYAKTGAQPSKSRIRLADAQRALADLAGETGGHPFLHGVRGQKIAERILADSDCLYTISFDPGRFREDAPLRVSVNVKRPGVKVRARGRMVFPSESSRLTTRLLRAFGTADEIADPLDVRIGLVPTGFDGGSYAALLQVSVPATPLQGGTWDLGASLISERKVRGETSGRIRVGGPGVPVVLESEVSFKPGEYEIVSVAHEAVTGLLASSQTVVSWPSPTDEKARVTPISLIQTVSAAFLRDGETRRRGSLAYALNDTVRIDRPTALIGLVCHSRRQKGPLQVERSLAGRSVQSFDPLILELGDDRCAQVRDVLPEDSLAPGFHRYDLRVVQDGETLHEASREFFAIPPETAP